MKQEHIKRLKSIKYGIEDIIDKHTLLESDMEKETPVVLDMVKRHKREVDRLTAQAKKEIGHAKFDKIVRDETRRHEGDARELAKVLKSVVSKEEKAEPLLDSIGKKIFEFINRIGTRVYNVLIMTEPDREISEKTYSHTLMFIAIVVMNTIMATLIMTAFMPIIMSSVNEKNILLPLGLVSIVVAPLTEEWGKAVAVRLGKGMSWTAIFATGEIALKKLNSLQAGYDINFLHTIPAFFMHFLTTATQQYYSDQDSKHLGFLMGVFIHAFFNASVILGAAIFY